VPPSPGDEVDWYTLPAIEYDGKIIMGSEKIADWLEEQYPDTTPLYPLKSKPLALLMENHLSSVRGFGLYKLVYQGILDSLDDSGREYYIRTRTELFGENINNPPTSEEIEQIWAQVPELSSLTAQLLQANEEGPYFLGHTRSYADLVLVASLQARRQCNKDAFDKLMAVQPSFKILYNACQDILQD
jgi:glutathione S-transferase